MMYLCMRMHSSQDEIALQQPTINRVYVPGKHGERDGTVQCQHERAGQLHEEEEAICMHAHKAGRQAGPFKTHAKEARKDELSWGRIMS